MSTLVSALPRTRRRKPPQARLVYALLMTVLCLLWLGRAILLYAAHDALLAGFSCALFAISFANWRREYQRTRRSEKEDRPLRPVSRFEWGFLTAFYLCVLW